MEKIKILEDEGNKIFINLGDEKSDLFSNSYSCRNNNNIIGFSTKEEPYIIYTRDRLEESYISQEEKKFFGNCQNYGYKIVFVYGFLKEKIKEIVEKELDNYINKNINNIGEYCLEDIIDNYKIYKNKDIEMQYKFSINFSVKRNYTAESEDKKIVFDFKTMSFLVDNKTIFEYYTGENFRKMKLLEEQIKRKTVSVLASGMVEILDFLDDKKSITVVLKNGEEIKDIADGWKKFAIRQDKIFYDFSYKAKPESEDCPIDNIDCFKYSNKILKINSENFDLTKIKNNNII